MQGTVTGKSAQTRDPKRTKTEVPLLCESGRPDAKRDGHTSSLEIIQLTVGKDFLRLTDGAALQRERISRSQIKSRFRERDRLKACYG